MEKFTQLDAVAVPIAQDNCDTDQLIPARYLQKPRSDDFGQYLFRDRRLATDGTPIPGFALNDARYAGCRIMVGGVNFGCGSSREHAVWALHDFGIRAVIAPSFGDIFTNNCLKNGLIPIALDRQVVADLLADIAAQPGVHVRVDLPGQSVSLPRGNACRFEINGFAKSCLLQGLDELDYTLRRLDLIESFEHRAAAVDGIQPPSTQGKQS